MEMFIGGAFQGKTALAKREFPNIRFEDGTELSEDGLLKAEGILHFEEYIRRMLSREEDVSLLAEKLIEQNPAVVIVCREVGYGVVPIDPFERKYREAVGRICTKLAAFSNRVTRVVCGIGTVIKNICDLWFIRHGMTPGNKEKRYIGCRTDEHLLPEAAELLRRKRGMIPEVGAVYTSPMVRCLETAEILFPEFRTYENGTAGSVSGQKSVQVIKELIECDFGRFEGHNYKELSGDPDYQKWIDSGGSLPFPDGDSREDFLRNSKAGLLKVIEDMELRGIRSASVVTHGGVIMNLMEAYARPGRSFYEWSTENGGIRHVRFDTCGRKTGNFAFTYEERGR